MKRLLTAAVAVPLALAAMFLLPPLAFFGLMAVLINWGAVEFVRIARPLAPGGPLGALPLLVPASAAALLAADRAFASHPPGTWLFGAALLLSVGLGSIVLWARTPVQEALIAIGILAFGTVYFSLPIAALTLVQAWDPWLLFLLCGIVWLGDTAAYYVGTHFGRHRLAPVVSPNKSWEGASAGFVIGVAFTAIWSQWHLGTISPGLLAVAAFTAVASQTGDLVESLIKRGAGVKDSGGVLPGHGGMFDRMDAMLFAAPVFLAGLWWIDLQFAGR